MKQRGKQKGKRMEWDHQNPSNWHYCACKCTAHGFGVWVGKAATSVWACGHSQNFLASETIYELLNVHKKRGEEGREVIVFCYVVQEERWSQWECIGFRCALQKHWHGKGLSVVKTDEQWAGPQRERHFFVCTGWRCPRTTFLQPRWEPEWPASMRAVAPPAHINWPPMDLVKKEHSWAINQEWGGWSFQCAAKAQGVCGNSGLRMQDSGWKAQMLLLKSTRLSGSDKPPLSLWPYLCHFMTFCSTLHACMHTRI